MEKPLPSGPIESPTAPSLSIVVPVGPGDTSWRGLIPCLQHAPFAFDLVLSACEPRPGDLDDLAAQLATLWVVGSAGRAAQLNRGVRAARCDALWILHADSRPSDRVLAEAARPVTGDAIAWFPLRFAPARPFAVRLNAWGANLRSRWLDLPFGDQGWRLERTLIERLGGFDPDCALGEDLDFIVRARHAGVRLLRRTAPLTTSPRRYLDQGWWRTTSRHLRLTAALWRDARRRLPT